ncbi:hypothetical protein BX666DRAFT_1917223 [Dichotomocladium elegans]|nr:hypothetical protein BX666DRAFT_1917223 [Dichotomocladium elegans]
MDNVTPIDPSLLAEWSRAIVNVDLERVQQLYTDDLLWQPLDKSIARIDTDYAHLSAQLERFQLLGPTLGDLAALPYTLLDHIETSDAEDVLPSLSQQKRARLLSFLIRKVRPEDLNNLSWGTCQNKTLHLATFLGQKKIVSQLVERGASMTSRNTLGYTPTNVIQQQQQVEEEEENSKGPTTHLRQSPTRFEQLRARVESTEDLKKPPQGRHRKQDIALLAQRSAVKNNPLYKKFEQQHQQQQSEPLGRGSSPKKKLLMPETGEDRRASKIISALKTKSYVSSSIFRQGEPERAPSPAASSRASSPFPEREEPEEEQEETVTTTKVKVPEDQQQQEQEEKQPKEPEEPPSGHQQQEKETLPSPLQGDTDADGSIGPSSVLDELEKQKEHLANYAQQQQGDEGRRWSGSQRSHWSAGTGLQHRQSVQSDGEQWYDSYEDWSADQRRQQQQQQKDDALSPLRQSMALQEEIDDVGNDRDPEDVDKTGEEEEEPTPTQSVIDQQPMLDHDATSIESTDPSVSFSPKQRASTGAESVDTWPPPSSPYAARAMDDEDEHCSPHEENSVAPAVPPIPDSIREKTVHTKAECESPPLAMPEKTQQYGSISLRTTESYATHRIGPGGAAAAATEESEQEYQTFLEHEPPAMKLELRPVDHHPSQSSSAFGKLYVRLTSAENILLPLPPKFSTYVRCVVSDGDQYEYVSRYELLGEKVVFEYECIMDARPDMIITVALHVRPDPHVQRKSGLARLFTSARKQRESLPAYVHPEDGAIGQTRFALGHMIQACNQKTYGASFDCFNSWFLRSSRERHLDMLKVVGNLNIEMLYLPVLDPTRLVPKTMRECDLSLRIRQWHNTCWHSGYLSMRVPGSQLWDRHYCRLIGSQLIAYASKDVSEWRPLKQFDIADAVRLVASTDQVIVTLVDVPDQRVFQPDSIVEETSRGYFRIIFAGAHVDCVSDEASESEEWVKVLKSMIGRVPLKLASADL